MAINLQKGQCVDIGLSKISIGLGWNPNEGTGYAFDLDASAFMIDQKRMIPNGWGLQPRSFELRISNPFIKPKTIPKSSSKPNPVPGKILLTSAPYTYCFRFVTPSFELMISNPIICISFSKNILPSA